MTSNKTLKEKREAILLGIKLEDAKRIRLKSEHSVANNLNRKRIAEEIANKDAYIERLEDNIEALEIKYGG